MGVKVQLTLLMTTLIIAILATGVSMVFPQITAQIATEPHTIENIFPDGSFTIDLTVADAYDTQMWEANITFDPTILEVVSASEGEFLKSGSSTFFDYTAPPDEGWVYIAATYYFILGPGNGVNGDGTLADITFQVKDRGHSPIHFLEDLTRLWYNNGTAMVIQPRNLDDGYFTNLHDVSISSVTVSATQVTPGDQVSVNVTVVNQGDFTETFDLVAFRSLIPFPNLTTIDTMTDIALGAGATTSLAFTWDTTGARSGIYNITAEVPPLPEEADTADNKGTATELVNIPGAPVAFFTYTPEKPTLVDTVIFDASKSYDPDDPATGIVSHSWDFGDGTSRYYVKNVNLTDAVTKNYTAIGNYDVILTVTDIENLTDTYPLTLTISAPAPPVAAFICTTEERLVNRSVAFDASDSYDPDGSIVSYEWNFGDGSDPEYYEAPNGETVTHIYGEAETYTVNLTVTDNHGASVSTTLDVTVSTKRDIFVDKVTCYRPNVLVNPLSRAYVGETLNISISVGNDGTQSETFNLTVHYDGPSTGTLTQEVANLPPADQAPHNEKKVGIFWDTTPISAGNYTITVEAVLDEDQNLTNNNASTKITMNIPPDVAITNVIVSPTTVLAGNLLNITVFIKNEGTSPVDCTAKIYFSNETHSNISPQGSIELTQSVQGLEPDEEEAVYFRNWNQTKSQLRGPVRIFPGTYTLSAEVLKVSIYEFDLDDNSHVYGDVTIGASLISILASENTTTVGSTITINGSITPTRPGANVTVWYRLSDEENWSILETLATDENSTYTYSWEPENSGTYHLKASWLGDGKTLPDESDILEIKVRERPLNILLYAAVGVAAIAAVAAAIYFLKVRKTGKQTQ